MHFKIIKSIQVNINNHIDLSKNFPDSLYWNNGEFEKILK
jgi:hypothetical protein